MGARDLRFQWGGDTAGQGWGINPDFGGMKIYEAMRQRSPLFFIHSGDTIYADGPIAESVVAEDGQVWNNIVTPQVAKVAETLDEFRGRYRYNLLDENVRRFNAEVPQIWQWDDHEVTNNWSDVQGPVRPTRVTAKRTCRCWSRAARARFSSMRRCGRSMRANRSGSIDVTATARCSSCSCSTCGRTAVPTRPTCRRRPSDETAFLGREQLDWLKAGLKESRAVWKVVAADMPIGLNVGDGAPGGRDWEAVANGEPGAAKGRELEIAELLSYLKRRRVRNVVWLTADVHYCAAHYYDPAKAAFRDFDAFWEFVAGPLNAGSFGPNTLDGTFGPQVVFVKAPPAGQSNLSPYSGLQFFGEVNIDAQSADMTVDLRDIDGRVGVPQETAAQDVVTHQRASAFCLGHTVGASALEWR